MWCNSFRVNRLITGFCNIFIQHFWLCLLNIDITSNLRVWSHRVTQLAGMCQHTWTCRHVLMCVDMCRYVPTCSITLCTSDTNHSDLICALTCVSTCVHADMCWYVPKCADMCRHVPTRDITLGTRDTNHLDLICIPVCVSTCGYATCVDMCWHVPTCANMWHHYQHLWYQPFQPYFHADVCQYIWTCQRMPTCANMCHVQVCANMWKQLPAPLIPTIWTLSACWHVSAHLDMPTCADMLPTCANM